MTNITLDRFLNSQKLAGSIFLVMGANKTCSDYFNSDKKYRNKFLIKDTAILAGAGAGMILQKKYTSKLFGTKLLKKLSEIMNKIEQSNTANKYSKTFNYSREIISDTLKNVSLFACGILGAITTDIILSQIKALQVKNPIPTEERPVSEFNEKINSFEHFIDKKVDKVIIDDDVKNAMYDRITDMPQFGILTGGFAGTSAIDLAKENELKTKLQNAGSCIINNSLLPMLYLAIANVITKNMKPQTKIPAIFGILVGGTLLTSKITELNMKFLSQKNLMNYITEMNILSRIPIEKPEFEFYHKYTKLNSPKQDH